MGKIYFKLFLFVLLNYWMSLKVELQSVSYESKV